MAFKDFIPALAAVLGAFVAAWAGATLGFRRSRKERALDRQVSWHEEAIESLARYEEQLERLRRHSMNELVIQRSASSQPQPPSTGADASPNLPPLFRVPAAEWARLGELEERARTALRLGDVFTEGKLQLEVSVALSNCVNLVSNQWFDVSSTPQVQWADLPGRAMRVATLRRSLQQSLRAVLELDGLVATILGERYRRWRLLRKLNRLRAQIGAVS